MNIGSKKNDKEERKGSEVNRLEETRILEELIE